MGACCVWLGRCDGAEHNDWMELEMLLLMMGVVMVILSCA